jgi:hypothetical protein
MPKPKQWIQKAVDPDREGKFAAKAKRAGMTTLQYANYVLRPESKATTLTKQQANFALTLMRMGKK